MLITGGARSGKSRHALELAADERRRAFVAAAEPIDDEMRRRIERHREERGDGWLTVEEPIDLAGALDRLPADVEVVVVDCLTVWLGNLVHRAETSAQTSAQTIPDARHSLAEPARFPEIAALLARLEAPHRRTILVGNEVGWGIVPDSPLARDFRDLAGRVNEEVARRADRVVLMVAGRPLEVAGGRDG
ncbi:MAG TPA: bifunctional adenosylcobinamide kinase/adenosylcobinamide-phosphate guanylyltransferase [Thermoanaerobaculia bacterium]|nr:bifunctional adenosylcobinamide kinase/adenosylcobinamide-phosphate guanylyltransferase [Thermoanaerobaculia bacterium]